ncbi:MAG: efflux RND transporter periplasmic adaptor subunit, partial [bacterium]|nr:efflux RND transporter periplasmic adaptor subunit [bacterium]
MKLLKWMKSHWFISILLVLLVTGITYKTTRPDAPPEILTETVSRSTLLQTVDVTGEIKSIDTVDLAFNRTGQVDGVFVTEGDIVGIGSLLANLDISSLFANPAHSTETLRRAEELLASTTNGVSSSFFGESTSIVSADSITHTTEIALENAREDLVQAKVVQGTTITESETTLVKAENDLAQTQATQAEDSRQIKEDFPGILQGNIVAIRTALSDADEILGITNTLANDDFEYFLSLTNYQTLITAENAYNSAIRNLASTEETAFNLNPESDYASIDAAQIIIVDLLDKTAKTLLYTLQALDATTIDSAAFTFADLAAKKTLIDTARNNIRTEQDSLESQIQLRRSSDVSQTSVLTAKQDAVEAARQALAKTKAQQTLNVTTAEAALATAEANLRKNIASSYETITSEDTIRRDAELRSPINGIVTSVDINPGEFATAGTTLVTIESVEGGFEIKANIPEADIAKIRISQPADIQLDAYSSDLSFPAQVSFINPAEKLIEGVVFYEVTLFFTALENLPILKPGMTTDITILTAEMNDVISVSQRAILSRDGDRYVRLKEGEEIIERNV